MQLRCVQSRPGPHAAARQTHAAGPLTRCSRVCTRYQNDDASHVSLDDVSSAPPTREVSAEDTYAAAVANMPEGAWAGRWERWAPPAEGFRGGIVKPDDTGSVWQLLTSGQSVYLFQPSSPSSLSVSVMEAPDSPPVSLAQAAAQAATEAALGAANIPTTSSSSGGGSIPGYYDAAMPSDSASEGVEVPRMMPSHRSGSVGGSNVMRAQNSFSKVDHFFRPFLPDQTQPGGDVGQRLWAADALGFAMAPTSLPLSLLHTKGTAAPATALREAAPFIANLYIKHPSLEPGVGRRWGWNLQFDASINSSTGGGASGGSLQHIHHTSLGLVKGAEEGAEGQGGSEGLMQPGPHTRPPTTPGPLPPSIAAFMSGEGHHWLRCNGSAVEWTYDGGKLMRTDLGDCSWHSGPGAAGGVAEVWYASGGYSRCPVALQAELAAGRPVVIEAGAIIYRGPSLLSALEGVARWLLTYRAGDGQLESVRLEVYRQHGNQ